MRIVTWNIRGALGMDGRRRLDRIEGALQGWSPDVVCLQEVHRYLPGGAFSDQMAGLARSLGMYGRFDPAMRGIGCFGNALLSRWPLHQLPAVVLPNVQERKRPGLWLERRVLQRAKIATLAGSFTLMNTHWSLDGEDRRRAAEKVSSLLREAEGPLLLCGDFNAITGSQELVALESAGLTDLGAAGGRPTYPSDLPISRIDYIWGRGVHVQELQVLPTVASDHCSVLAEVEFW